MTSVQDVHKNSIIIDGTCPLASYQTYWQNYMIGGVTVVSATVNRRPELMRDTLGRVGEWYNKIRLNEGKLLQVQSVEDIYRAKKENKLGILFHFQGTTPFETDINNIEIFYRLGLRMVQLTYNIKDFVGDGCAERTDCGLSHFGVKLIGELNRLGIVVDCAHTGYRTTMDAIEVSEKPVIVSHGNVWALCMNGYPAFVAKKAKPHLDDLLDHSDYIAKLVGVEHISVGIDYYEGQAGVADESMSKALYDKSVQDGTWNPRDYPPPPWYYPEGIEMPDKLPNLTAALLKRGYSEEDVKKILGLNLIRVFQEVWL